MNNYYLCLFIFFLGNACTLAKAALLNEIRTLKQAGRHPNIVNLIGTWIQGGETYFDYPNNILANLRKKYVFIHVMKSTGQGNQVARKLDLAEILKTNISKELYPVKIIEEVNSQKDIFVNFQNYANEL